MLGKIAVRCQQVSKYYPIYRRPSDRLRQWLWGRYRQYHKKFWAVRDLSLEIARGEVVGILGKNGSGKSTLLQMISGCINPSHGEIVTQGRVAALLELGSGFNPEFTGLENVYINAAILGLHRQETEERLAEILAFADIGEFIYQPVKNYSSGMAMRLAFAVASMVEPDILIVDEALAVGDIQFQAKCFRHFNQLIARGTTIIFVTHSTEQVVRHCSRAFLMDAGELIDVGEPRIVVNHYLELLLGKPTKDDISLKEDSAPIKMADKTISLIPRQQFLPFEKQEGYNPSEYRWGNQSAAIESFHLSKHPGGEHQTHFMSGELLIATLQVKFHKCCLRPIFGLTIKTVDGVTVYGNNSRDFSSNAQVTAVAAESTLVICFELFLWLNQGDYLISFGVATDETGDVIPLDRRYDAVHIIVSNPRSSSGLAELQMHCCSELLIT